MTVISTLSQQNLALQGFQQMQSQQTILEQEISTGLKSTSFAGIAKDAAPLINLQAQVSQQQSYVDTITTVGTRMSTMSTALQDIQTQVSKFAASASGTAYNTTYPTIQEQAKSLLSIVGDDLNTQDGTRYVFSGGATSSPAFSPNTLQNPAQLGSLSTSYYGGDNTISKATIDNGVSVNYGITANNPAITKLVDALNFFANSPPLSASNTTDAANVATATNELSTGLTALQDLQGNLALQQDQLNSRQTALQTSLSLANTTISNLESVDSSTAITQLNTLQTQLQSSYQAVSIIQSLSLATYLK